MENLSGKKSCNPLALLRNVKNASFKIWYDQ